ncbi:T9SS type A sorting domain-containing protein [Prevotella sp. MA2016]|uniref:T9SS type A sorting domain-containing protein n=1 Tax=Prevotella sp. MA2016 TaxID=1408310 RepID=UPI000684999F|nr:T9SS type A sorting domain-containing protein [Prevotella sp. MA2016]
MRRFLLISTILFLLAAPVLATGMLMDPAHSTQIDDVSIVVEGRIVTVSGAQGEKLKVVSLTGRLVAEYNIDAPVQRVELNLSKGCYILKVGKVVRKVSIQ